jgi:hypothetical protein
MINKNYMTILLLLLLIRVNYKIKCKSCHFNFKQLLSSSYGNMFDDIL